MADSLEARIAERVVRALEGGDPVLVATVMAAPDGQGEHVGAKLLVRSDGSTLGSLGVAPLDAVITSGAAEAFQRHRVHTLYLSPEGEEQTRR